MRFEASKGIGMADSRYDGKKHVTTPDDIKRAGGFLSTPRLGGRTIDAVEFDNLSALAEFEYCLPITDGYQWRYGSHIGFNTLATCQQAIRDGRCPEAILELYRKMRESLEPKVGELIARMPSAKRVRKFGVEGSEIDHSKVMVGNPEAWESRKRGQVKETVRIFINFMYSSGTSKSEIARGAARGIALADILVRMGHNVEITGSSFTEKYGQRYAITFPIKESTKPVDPQAFLVIALPAFSRVFGFGVLDVWARANAEDNHHVGVVSPEHVDYFGIDVFATGDDFRYMGQNAESHIAEAVREINSALVAPITDAEAKAVTAFLNTVDMGEAC